MNRYQRVTRFVSQQVWAIREETLDVMVELLRMRAAGISLSQEEIQARIGAGRQQPTLGMRGSVAVMPLYGVIAPKMDAMTAISGGTSMDAWLAQFRQYRDDPNVSAIVADIDTPGGSVFGIPEAFEEIYKSRDAKPLIGVVNPCCASAGMWLASAFSEIVSTPSGESGSIGVFMTHESWEKANEMMGVKPTYIYAGKYKVEGNPDQDLTDDTIAHLQAQVDTVYGWFKGAVAKGRGTSTSVVEKDFGQGRMLFAKDAKDVGLIDRIATLDETVMRAAGRRRNMVAVAPVLNKVADSDGQIPEAEQCPSCKGTGLQPERFMSDPQGQEDCPVCAGTGRNAEALQVPIVAETGEPSTDGPVQPDDQGNCPEGFEKGADDLCYLAKKSEASAVAMIPDTSVEDATLAIFERQ